MLQAKLQMKTRDEMRTGRLSGCGLLAGVLLAGVSGWGQQAPAPPADPVAVPPQTPSSTPATPAAPTNTPAPVVSPAPAPAPPPEPLSEPPQTPSSTPAVPKQGVDAASPSAAATPAPANVPATGKKGKNVYAGPASVVVLEPTPMLDEEGRQRLDPMGKPMFNPPVAQQRDKKGHPLFDAQGKPVFQTATELGYDENGKRIHVEKEKKTHTVAVSIVQGTMTVDGMTGRAGLNYEIKDFKYVYLYVPWIGMTLVSNMPFPGASEEKDAFRENTLTVKAGDHVLELYSEKRLLGKKPESAYVLVDRNFSLQTKLPLVGYGDLRQAPYAFPGSKVEAAKKASAAPVAP